jgi:exonuclease III
MVGNLLRQWRADIVCLQETKLEFISRSLVRSIWGCPYVEYYYVASKRASGGILLMWDRRVVSKLCSWVAYWRDNLGLYIYIYIYIYNNKK